MSMNSSILDDDEPSRTRPVPPYAQSGDQLTLDVGASGAAYSSTFEIGIQV